MVWDKAGWLGQNFWGCANYLPTEVIKTPHLGTSLATYAVSVSTCWCKIRLRVQGRGFGPFPPGILGPDWAYGAVPSANTFSW